MARIFTIAIVTLLALLNVGCAGGFTRTTTYSSNLPEQPRFAPGLLPIPTVAYGVIPPGARVVDNQCGINDSYSAGPKGYGYGSGSRSCTVTFVTLQGMICTTNATEGGGMNSSTRTASKPSCKPLPTEQKEGPSRTGEKVPTKK